MSEPGVSNGGFYWTGSSWLAWIRGRVIIYQMSPLLVYIGHIHLAGQGNDMDSGRFWRLVAAVANPAVAVWGLEHFASRNGSNVPEHEDESLEASVSEQSVKSIKKRRKRE